MRIGLGGENLLYMTTLAESIPAGARYAQPGAIDEAVQSDGCPRAHWSDLLEALLGSDLGALAADARRSPERLAGLVRELSAGFLDDVTPGEAAIAAGGSRRPVLPQAADG